MDKRKSKKYSKKCFKESGRVGCHKFCLWRKIILGTRVSSLVLLLLGASPAEGRDVDGGGEDRVSRLGDGVGVVGEVLKIPNPRIDTKYPNTQIQMSSNANLSFIGICWFSLVFISNCWF